MNCDVYNQLIIMFMIILRLAEKHAAEQKAQLDQLEGVQRQLAERDQQVVRLAREVEEQRQLNATAPSESMKKRLEKLQNEIALKEKQNQVSRRVLCVAGNIVNYEFK
jgi:hypothetical protein